jgi:ankyrin repeat protein
MEAAQKLVDLGCAPDLFCAAGLGLIDALKSFWANGTLRPHPSTTGSSRYDESGTRLPCPPPNDADQVSDALYIACRSNRTEAARWLLDHGADPNWRGFCGASCLAWAEFAGNPELTTLLRERGGSDESRDDEFRATPKVFGLMILTAWGFPKRLRARLAADPSLVNARGGWGTLLNAAAFNGQMETAKVLLEFGADKTARNAAGLTATQMAASRGHKELAELLA